MEVNYVIQTVYDFNNEAKQLLDQVTQRITTVLHIQKHYVLSLIFVDEEQIHEINRSYRNIDKTTDVISFALMDQEDEYEVMNDEQELGDIFINVKAIEEQAQQYGHSHRRELAFLFTHGVLHLLGYDHMNEEDEKKMFTLQDEILNEIIAR